MPSSGPRAPPCARSVGRPAPASSRTEANDLSPQPPAHRAHRVARLTGRPARGIGEDPLAAVEISPAGRRSVFPSGGAQSGNAPVSGRSEQRNACTWCSIWGTSQIGRRRADVVARPARPDGLHGPDAEPGPGTIPVRCGHGAVLVLSIAGITLTAVESTSNGRSLARRQGAQADLQRREDAQVVGGVAERALPTHPRCRRGIRLRRRHR